MNGVRRTGRRLQAVRSHPFATDVALAALLCAATLAADISSRPLHGRTVSGALIVAAVVAYGGVLCRRRWPLAAVVATVAAATAFMTLSRAYGWAVTAPILALYHLAVVTNDRRRLLVAGSLAVLVLVGVPELVGHASGSGAWLDGAKLAVAATCGLALVAGEATRSRRAYAAEVEQRARNAERSREQEAQRRVSEERLRIARDLHDSLGHQIAVIKAQAGLASYVFRDQPVAAAQALDLIKRASRAALDDLRDTVGLLRQPGEPAAPTEPTVGVGSLADLVASFRGSGMRIDHQVDGPVRRLPPAADQTAYRVVQEALTNVHKHAGGAAARVRLCFRAEALQIVVEDDGNGRFAGRARAASQRNLNGAGHGIAGMRERVSALGGSLDVGPGPGNGYRVSATLPLPAGDRP